MSEGGFLVRVEVSRHPEAERTLKRLIALEFLAAFAVLAVLGVTLFLFLTWRPA